MRNILVRLLSIAVVVFACSSAQAQVVFVNTCSATVNELAVDHFDSAYMGVWNCNQVFINDAWSRFHLGRDSNWFEYGYTSPCNTTLPLARTFNALNVLYYAGTANPTCNLSDPNVLVWAACWAGDSFHYLMPVCPKSANATTFFGTFELNPRTELHKPFFYFRDVHLRASTLFHEARHADGWCSHTSRCRAGTNACDPNWLNGCVGFSSSSGLGSFGFGVVYNSWFANSARANYTNATLRQRSVDEGNSRLAANFEQDPCFRLDGNGVPFWTCP